MNENIENIQTAIYFLYNVSKFLICYNYIKFKSYALDYIKDFSPEYKKNVSNVILSKGTQTKEEGEQLMEKTNKKDI
tara:strand:+ start:148 stop:378 length:231 start_codon:yes stop_codon:yes gene_type:complete